MALQFVYRGAMPCMQHDVTTEDLGALLQQTTNFAPRAVAIVCESPRASPCCKARNY